MHGFTITCNDYGLGQYTQASGNGEHPEMDGEIVSSVWKHTAVLIDGVSVANLPEGMVEDRVNTLLTKDPNKLKIYLGHTVYELTVDGTKQLIRDDAVVHYKGSTYTGTELYNLLGDSNGKTN